MAVEEGFVPVAPHLLYPQFLKEDDESQREAGIRCGLELLSVCAELWVFDYTIESEGMNREISFAEENEIPVKYMQPDRVWNVDGTSKLKMGHVFRVFKGENFPCR